MALPKMKLLELVQHTKPFSRSNWIFEIKCDGFRALAHVENGACTLTSRKGMD